MKNIKRTLALLLAMVMVLTMLPLAAVAEGETETPAQTAEPQWPNQGAINLKKEANATENDYEYEITLTIEGKNYHTTSDVVLVIDVSGSMEGNRIENTRTAAKAFGDKLLTKGSETRIAIVTVVTKNRKVTTYNSGHFYDSTELDAFKTAVDTATKSITGGTNTQAGIHEAQNLLNSDASTGKLKNIVLLSDGVPTYSYRLTGTATQTGCGYYADWIPLVGGSHYNGTIDESTIAFTGCDYTTLCGNGQEDQANSGGEYVLTVTCAHGETRTEEGFQAHSVATIWEANQAKAKGTTVYSVALQAGTDGEATLKSCASDPTKGYFAISSNETDVEGKLTSAFTAIAGSIAIAAKDGVVTDPMSQYVSFKPADDKLNPTTDKQYEDTYAANGYDVYISQGIVAWDEATKTFTWETGNINEGVPAIMKYRVTLNDNVELGGDPVPTNGTTSFAYTNYRQKRTTKNFNPIPTVTKGGGTIMLHFYRVDADGNPVNGAGVQVDTPSQAEVLAEAHLYEVAGKTSLVYDTYEVPAETIENAIYYGYTLSEDVAVTKGGAPSVTLNAQNSVAHVWFAYYEGFNIVHVTDGKAGDAVTYPVQANFNITDEVTEGYLYGGTFSDEECEDIWQFGNENPTDFTPEAGKTYYIWEVSQNYLMPKTYAIWAHPIEEGGNICVTRLYLVSSVDRDGYDEYGFVYNDDLVPVEELYGSIDVMKLNGDGTQSPHDHMYVETSGSVNVSSTTDVEQREGYIVFYGLGENDKFADFKQDGLTFQPYWITKDHVLVTGNEIRTCSHRGAGSTDDYKKITIEKESDAYSVTPWASSASTVSVQAVYTLDWDSVPAIVEPEQPTTVTITVHDGDTYVVTGEPGKFEVTPKGAEGKLFAGWYADEAFTEAADLTDVQEDADIYAKYVSDNYLQVKYNNLGLLGRGSLRLVSAVDSKAYAETGFVVNGEKIVVSSYTTRYNLQNGKSLFGVGRNDPLMVASYSYRNLRRGDTITLQAYWVTQDGTTVYGDMRTLTYGRFGLEG